jgi:coenzyme F420-reducing hydrogenase delta subunit
VNPERLHFYNLSAAEGPRWAEICSEFTDRVLELGPSPIWLALKQRKEASSKESKKLEE